jgi:hypothetical protein
VPLLATRHFAHPDPRRGCAPVIMRRSQYGNMFSRCAHIDGRVDISSELPAALRPLFGSLSLTWHDRDRISPLMGSRA